MKTIPVLYDDADILVVNKPAGVAVQGGAGVSVSVLDILERQTGTKMYPIHRLDKETSGILVVARSSSAAAEYSRYIADKALVKEYRAVCFGMPKQESGKISIPIGRPGDEKPAETSYRVESSTRFSSEPATLGGEESDFGATVVSLISLALGTGRMHQIRVHLASLGCPIIADDKYGDFKRNRAIRATLKVRKLQLCACALAIPIGSSLSRFAVPLPEHMTACLAAIGLSVPE